MEAHIAPKILQCNYFTASGTSINERYIRDYEFDFYLDGPRDVYIDGQHHRISKGCMLFKKPGQLVRGSSNYNMYMLTLNFDRDAEVDAEKYVRSSLSPQQKPCGIDLIENLPQVFIPAHRNELEELYALMSKYSFPNIVNEAQQEHLVREFLLLLLSDACRYTRDMHETSGKTNCVAQACHYINMHYPEEITVRDLADYLFVSENHLIRMFKQKLDTTPNRYIQQIRLFYASQMLLQTDTAIENIAFSCGFKTPSYFIKCFKTVFGDTPSMYRKKAFPAAP